MTYSAIKTHSGQIDLYVYDSETENITKVNGAPTHGNAAVENFSFNPQANIILYVTDNLFDGQYNYYVYLIETGQTFRVNSSVNTQSSFSGFDLEFNESGEAGVFYRQK